jgi:predicted N-acyltransferase
MTSSDTGSRAQPKSTTHRSEEANPDDMSFDYRTQVHASIDELPATQWDALAQACGGDQPFMRHRFLQLLEHTGCATAQTGWQPMHLAIWHGQQLKAAAPLWLKSHSYGEYVFDWAWADAYRRHGLQYYPKLLSAVPFTPVPGTRLLACDEPHRRLLARALVSLAQQQHRSSLHVLFPSESEAQHLVQAGALQRRGIQFHWRNQDWTDFEQFLQSLNQTKRKKIRAERRKVREAGVELRRLRGRDITAADWEAFSRFYENTYAAHQSTPYLNQSFFEGLGADMPESLLMVMAWRQGERIAASLLMQDSHRLYGRYWGASQHIPCLHFEACYYQPIEAAIEAKIAVIEGGAQGEHKMARGFDPVSTYSAHWLAEPMFADAVDRFLQREGHMLDGYMDELAEHSAFKAST